MKRLENVNWKVLHKGVCWIIFISIAICCSWLGFQLASKWALAIGIIIFCAMVAYDLFLAPNFPNAVLYVNNLFAIAFSILLLFYIGICTSAAIVSKDKDPYQSTLAQMNNDLGSFKGVLEGLIGGSAINANNDVLQDSSRNASKLLDRTIELQDKELAHAKEKGEYSSGYLLAHKWVSEMLGEDDTDAVTFVILCIMWLAIISIQTSCSAYVHGREIHRPSLLSGLTGILDFIFSLKGHYADLQVRNKRNNVKPKEDKKDEAKKELASTKDATVLTAA